MGRGEEETREGVGRRYLACVSTSSCSAHAGTSARMSLVYYRKGLYSYTHVSSILR